MSTFPLRLRTPPTHGPGATTGGPDVRHCANSGIDPKGRSQGRCGGSVPVAKEDVAGATVAMGKLYQNGGARAEQTEKEMVRYSSPGLRATDATLCRPNPLGTNYP